MMSDAALVLRARGGDELASQRLVERYRGFVRLKASSYFLLGGESDDLIQEGLLGLYKAIRDYRTDRESSFRNFAELCITRQIITAVKTATRNKHTPLNQYVSFSQTPAAAGDSETTLDEILPGPSVHDPVNQVIATEEWGAFVTAMDQLSSFERVVVDRLSDGSYEDVAAKLGVSVKAVDNAVQRARRKLREALLTADERAWSAGRPKLIDQIRGWIARHPNSTAAEISRGINAPYASVSGSLNRRALGPGFTSHMDGRRRRWRCASAEAAA